MASMELLPSDTSSCEQKNLIPSYFQYVVLSPLNFGMECKTVISKLGVTPESIDFQVPESLVYAAGAIY